MITIFHWESLECYPCIKRWYDHVIEDFAYWRHINQDYESFVQYVNSLTENEVIIGNAHLTIIGRPLTRIFSWASQMDS
jgi:hypothetical protein